jgi:type IV pilus assembly protein PilO
VTDWIERFLGLEPRQKVGLILGLPMLILVFYYVFVVGPRIVETRELRQRVSDMREDRVRKEARTADREKKDAELRNVETALATAMTQLPDRKEIPDLLSSISLLGRDSGLDILVFRQRPEVYREFYAEVPVEMEVRGTYHQVAAFLDEVGRLDRIVNVSNIAVTNPEIDSGELLLKARSRVTTFRFLSEDEREKLAEEGKIEGGKAGKRS